MMDLKTAITNWNATQDKSAAGYLKKTAAGRALFIAKDGKIDEAATVKAFAFSDRRGAREVPDGQTWDDLTAQPEEQDDACPVTGAALFLGKTTTTPALDYSGIDHGKLLVVAAAADMGEVPPTLKTADDILFHLRRSGEVPTSWWPRSEKVWASLRDKVDRDDDEEARFRRIRARLRYDEARDTTLRRSRPAPAPATDYRREWPAPTVHVGGVPQGATAPLVFFVVSGDPADKAAYEAVKLNLSMAVRNGRLRTISTLDFESGVVRDNLARNAQEAAVIVPLVSAAFFASDTLLALAESYVNRKPVAPLVVTTVLAVGSKLDGLVTVLGGSIGGSDAPGLFTRGDRSHNAAVAAQKITALVSGR